MSASSTSRAVSLTFGLPSSLSPIERPLTVCVGQAFRMLKPTVLAAGCVRGMIAPVNSPPVASDPVPVAGQRALAAPLRHHGLNRRTGSATAGGARKVAAALPRRRPDVLQAARRRAIDSLRSRPRRTCDSGRSDRRRRRRTAGSTDRRRPCVSLVPPSFSLKKLMVLSPHRPRLVEAAARGTRSSLISR